MSTRRSEYSVIQKRGQYGKEEIVSADSLEELREKIEAMGGESWD
ncbi:hypothetical protein [Halomicrobium urmianum]|nr:hypothetical protein [Halomicrobium urmianum]